METANLYIIICSVNERRMLSFLKKKRFISLLFHYVFYLLLLFLNLFPRFWRFKKMTLFFLFTILFMNVRLVQCVAAPNENSESFELSTQLSLSTSLARWPLLKPVMPPVYCCCFIPYWYLVLQLKEIDGTKTGLHAIVPNITRRHRSATHHVEWCRELLKP